MAAKKQECMIIGAAPIEDVAVFREFPPENYYVICADAGYETAARLHITPDLIVGDFDSAKAAPPKSRKVLSIPVKKDVTDTMYAVMMGRAKGFRSFVLLGGLGGARFDHSLANIEVLQYLLAHNCRGVMADSHTKVLLISDSRLRLTQMKGATVSVFPYNGSNCNVSYTGLLYPLDHASLTAGGILMGVSNSVTEDVAEIRVHIGTALVVVYQE